MRLRSLVWAALLASVAVAAPQARANELVTNGGFELQPDFTGWTQGGDTCCNGISVAAKHSGFLGADLGTFDAQHTGTLSQQVSTTPGSMYDISFWLELPNDSDGASFSASFGSTTFTPTLATKAFPYTHYQFTAAADGASQTTNLGFTFDNGPSFWYLDDVTVNAASVPGPLAGAGLPGLLAGFGAVLVWYRKKRAAV